MKRQSAFTPTRRECLAAGLVFGVSVLSHPARADDELAASVRAFTGGAPVREGKVKLEVAELVENGNTVPITVSVASPMTPEAHVKTIAVFNERNPQRDVAVFHLGPRAGRATVATRIRLATSQRLVAVARLSDDTWWSHSVEVIVTIAGCVES